MLFAPLVVQPRPYPLVVARSRLLAKARLPSVRAGIENLAGGKTEAMKQLGAILRRQFGAMVALAVCGTDQSLYALVDGKFVHRASIAQRRFRMPARHTYGLGLAASSLATGRRVTNG